MSPLADSTIVPLQMKMVYRIGQQRGHELDHKSIGEFMATVGIGLASQVFEGFARRLTKGLGRAVAGKLGGRIGDAVGGIVMSFASTCALGHLAQKYTTQITEQSQKLQGAGLSSLLKGGV